MKLRAAVGAAVPLRRWTAIMCTRQTPGNPSPGESQWNHSAELHLPNPHLPRLLPKERIGATTALVDESNGRNKGELITSAESVLQFKLAQPVKSSSNVRRALRAKPTK
jgi:hypothetical protein